MPAGSNASPAKLKITAYEKDDYSGRWEGGTNPLFVQVNPKSLAQQATMGYTRARPAGGTPGALAFSHQEGQNLSLQLLFDGTGAIRSGEDKSVDLRIGELKAIAMRTNGAIHEPNYLVLSWGSWTFRGRMTSLNINYSLFHSDGTPLRATVDAKFAAYRNVEEAKADLNLTSPDLTHLRTVMAGDSLPLMCHRIYGDSRHYLAVAEANGLADFRRLPVGAELVFPPLEKPGR